MNNM